MKEFILDKNVDLKPDQQNYPEYFFDDLKNTVKLCLVIGGTDYRQEIRGKYSLLELILELDRSGRVRSVNDQEVDAAQARLIGRIDEVIKTCPNECDDLHIFALALVSRCLNILTNDNRIARCRNRIRNTVGHDFCPNVRVVSTERAYRATP